MIRLEFYDLARARAGKAFLDVDAATLGGALRAAAAACPGLVPDVVRGDALADHFRASRNGHAFVEDPATSLADGDTVLILSAQAGG